MTAVQFSNIGDLVSVSGLTWVRVILEIIASLIFSPFVGYGFFPCSFSQAFKIAVDSLVIYFLVAVNV